MQAVGCLVIGVLALAQFVAAIWGLETYVGWLAVPIIVLCVYFQFTLPITIFAFLGAKNEWDWHWAAALVFVAPGLLFLVPSILAQVTEHARSTLRRGKRNE